MNSGELKKIIMSDGSYSPTGAEDFVAHIEPDAPSKTYIDQVLDLIPKNKIGQAVKQHITEVVTQHATNLNHFMAQQGLIFKTNTDIATAYRHNNPGIMPPHRLQTSETGEDIVFIQVPLTRDIVIAPTFPNGALPQFKLDLIQGLGLPALDDLQISGQAAHQTLANIVVQPEKYLKPDEYTIDGGSGSPTKMVLFSVPNKASNPTKIDVGLTARQGGSEVFLYIPATEVLDYESSSSN